MVVAKGAGSFLGGILNNPGAIILGGIAIALLFFSSDIRKAFGSFGESFGKIELPDINLPQFNFPEINFPEIKLPEFNFPELPSLSEFNPFGIPAFVDKERIDVEFGDTGQIIDVVPDVTGGTAERLRNVIGLTPAQIFGIEERGAMDPRLALEPSDAELFARDFPEVFTTQQTTILGDPIPDIPFAVANVQETQAEFQERAGAFVEAFPELTGSTSLPGSEIVFGRQLSRNQEDFQSILDAEARRAESIFSALFGNVQNPDF